MKLIFVYNADAGRLNAAWDSAHKLLSPGTYRCSLCAVTHHPLGMKKQWSDFIESLECEVDFCHRDEAEKQFRLNGTEWPAVLRVDPEPVVAWLTAEQLGEARTLDQPQTLIRGKLDEDV
ncbi:MAG: hypothetical protein AAF663_12820 [Planctomycetota bacterium]